MSTVQSNRSVSHLKRLWAGFAVLAGVATGCGAGGHSSSPTTSRQQSSTTAVVTSTTAPGPQTSGSRTVLSPTGLRVRAKPSTSAAVLGSAAQGAVLTVLGYTDTNGGWLKVKGATVTGWISAKPTLSAPGEFRFFSSTPFSALYPATWAESALARTPSPPTTAPTQAPSTRAAPAPSSSVVFRPASGAGDIVVTSAGSIAQLPHGRAGYGRHGISQVVVCGITAGLVVYQQSTASQAGTSPGTSVPESLTYLAEVRFAVDHKHALGLYADMSDLGQTFQLFQAFIASVTFIAPQCTG